MFEERVTLSITAMATRFQIVAFGEDTSRLRSAAEEALAEIERIEEQLSIYKPESDLSRLNAKAAYGPVKVDPRLFEFLQHAMLISAETCGAFDMSVTPLLRAWGFIGGEGGMASAESIDAARELTGMHHISLDEENYTISFDRPGVELDPGAMGKGYAVERAADILRDIGVTSALVHGGTSTVCAIGAPPNQIGWPIAIRHPIQEGEFLSIINMKDSCLSVSAVHGKSFSDEGHEYGHVIDPRTGCPTEAALTAAVIGPSATDCDALSTALLVLGEPWLDELARLRPDYRGLVACMDKESNEVRVAQVK